MVPGITKLISNSDTANLKMAIIVILYTAYLK